MSRAVVTSGGVFSPFPFPFAQCDDPRVNSPAVMVFLRFWRGCITVDPPGYGVQRTENDNTEDPRLDRKCHKIRSGCVLVSPKLAHS
jgi:hypothetical protein